MRKQVAKQYAPAEKTDAFFAVCHGNYEGIEDRMARWIGEVQGKDRELWKLVVDQFRSNVDDEDRGWRGEYWGKLMRGACMTYQYTRDPELYDILTESVRDLLTTQQASGRFSTYSEAEEYHGWDMWSRKYILLGLLHFYEICTDPQLGEQIITALIRHADAILEHIGKGKKEITQTSEIWGGINSCSILEPMVRMYNQTGEQRYLEFAEYIVSTGGSSDFSLFETAYEDQTELCDYAVVKAYEMMSCFEGLLELYRVTGTERYLQTVVRFVERVRRTERSIIGCSGTVHELFSDTVRRQTDTTYAGIAQETCVAVTWMKLCGHLLRLTGEERYMEEIERSAYNCLYGSMNVNRSKNNGGLPFDSYSPLLEAKRGRKTGGLKFMQNGTYYGCCAAIGAAGTALIPQIGVMETRDGGVAFQLYMTGTTQCSQGSFEVRSTMPASGDVTITVHADGAFPILLRIPSYAQEPSVTVCGETVACKQGGYTAITREWKDGDVISLRFTPQAKLLHAVGFDEDPMSRKHIAITYGPLVLARDRRLGEVGTPVSIGTLSLKPGHRADFPVQCEFEAETEHGPITLIDYASAGTTWDDDSVTECWLPTERYQREVEVFHQFEG